MQHTRWFEAVSRCEARGEAYVLITVLGVTGSVPREPGTKMLVTEAQTYATIGGGHLELKVIEHARKKIAHDDFSCDIQHFPLGASLGQCCGGSVTILFEPRKGAALSLALFGAGHVAQALITVLGQLNCQVSWIDSRPEWFPDSVPANVNCIVSDDPVRELESLPAVNHHLILTHSHQLDFELCHALLQREPGASIGLIGSQTKANRFRQRLSVRGFDQPSIARIRCPVGLSSVPGKEPMAIAISIAAELLALQASGSGHQQNNARRGLTWPELRRLIGGANPQHILGEK